jgi:uridine kinase
MASLTDAITALPGTRVLVAIDGPDCAGKSTLADALADALAPRLPGDALRASIDDFHHPREYRQRRGPLSPDGYYRDSFDYPLLARLLLEPFRSGAREVVPRAFDPVSETRLPPEPVAVQDEAVLVFDGVFLLRPELRDHWDLSIYLDVAPEVTLARARERDRALFGSLAEVEIRYLERYIPGQALYRVDADPRAVADVLVDNSAPAAPVIRHTRLSGS